MRVQDLVVAALDHVDGVDLHVTQVLDGGTRRLGAGTEGRGFVQPLCVQPQAPRARLRQDNQMCR